MTNGLPSGLRARPDCEFVSTKTYNHNVGLSVCFRQWRAESHCRFLHGYALAVRFEFQAHDLDERNWVVDFGGLKDLKGRLEEFLDHKTLVAEDDPMLEEFEEMERCGVMDLVKVDHCGCEAMAKLIFETTEVYLEDAGYKNRVRLNSVEVSEHDANSAIYRRK